jgi:hypothetical protein
MKDYYSWDDVVSITNESVGRIYSSPFGDYSDSKFSKEEVWLDHIARDHYLTLDECLKLKLDEDEYVIRRLISAYSNGDNLPPVILTSDLKVIDGSHRLGALESLRIYHLTAFVEVK